MSKIEAAIKKIAKLVGVELSRSTSVYNFEEQVLRYVKNSGIELIIDVGANKGQFAAGIRARGYSGKIVSFEPLSEAYEKLLACSRGDKNWTVFERCALGSHEAQAIINIAGNSASSSLLPMQEELAKAAPHAAYTGHESIRIRTLDECFSQEKVPPLKTLLKIDTQGYEWSVLQGAQFTLPKVQAMLIEMSLVELYEGQELFPNMLSRLGELGFQMWAVDQVFVDGNSARTLQLDVFFTRI